MNTIPEQNYTFFGKTDDFLYYDLRITDYKTKKQIKEIEIPNPNDYSLKEINFENRFYNKNLIFKIVPVCQGNHFLITVSSNIVEKINEYLAKLFLEERKIFYTLNENSFAFLVKTKEQRDLIEDFLSSKLSFQVTKKGNLLLKRSRK